MLNHFQKARCRNTRRERRETGQGDQGLWLPGIETIGPQEEAGAASEQDSEVEEEVSAGVRGEIGPKVSADLIEMTMIAPILVEDATLEIETMIETGTTMKETVEMIEIEETMVETDVEIIMETMTITEIEDPEARGLLVIGTTITQEEEEDMEVPEVLEVLEDSAEETTRAPDVETTNEPIIRVYPPLRRYSSHEI